MPSDVEILFATTDSIVEVKNLRNSTTGALVTGATVTARLLDSSGSAVSGQADPFTLAEVSGKSGLYRGSINDTADLSVGDTGTIVITATDGTSVGTFTLNYQVRNAK